MPNPGRLDRTDVRILLELQREPRATVRAVAETLGLSRNTVQARITLLLQRTTLGPLDSGIDLGLLGYPLRVFITATVLQRMLDEVASALADIPEVIEVLGISGAEDLLIHTAAADASDLYRIAGMILATPGIERTETALVMRSLVDYRLEPLLERSIRRPPQGQA